MKKLFSLCLAISALAFGCASQEPWRGETIPYPRTTPFDANEFARRAFLDGFRSGYRAQRNEESSQVQLLTGPFARARQLGFYAGVAQARSELEGNAGTP